MKFLRYQAFAIICLFPTPAWAGDATEWLSPGYRQAAAIVKHEDDFILVDNASDLQIDQSYIRRISASGATQWEYLISYGGVVTDVALAPNGDIYAVGFVCGAIEGAPREETGGCADGYLVSVTPEGVRRFARYYGTPGDENFYEIEFADGHVYIGGWSQTGEGAILPGGTPTLPGRQTAVIAKFSEDGVLVGESVFREPDSGDPVIVDVGFVAALLRSPKGGLLVGGSVNGNTTPYLWLTDSNGSVVWARDIGNGAGGGWIHDLATVGETVVVHAYVDAFAGNTVTIVRASDGEQLAQYATGMSDGRQVLTLPEERVGVIGSTYVAGGYTPTFRVFDRDGVVLKDHLLSPEYVPASADVAAPDDLGGFLVFNAQIPPETGGYPRFLIGRYNLEQPFSTGGFRPPVDALPVRNRAKAGRVVPLRWNLAGVLGGPVSDSRSIEQISATTFACDGNQLTDQVETYAIEASGLKYLGNGDWQLLWKTERGWAEQCKRVTVEFSDSSSLSAEFLFH